MKINSKETFETALKKGKTPASTFKLFLFVKTELRVFLSKGENIKMKLMDLSKKKKGAPIPVIG